MVAIFGSSPIPSYRIRSGNSAIFGIGNSAEMKMMPTRAAERELVDRDRNRRWRRQEQWIDPAGAAGQLPKPDHQRERDPARIAARPWRKPRAAKFDRPRRDLAIGLRCVGRIVRALKHAGPRARRRSPP